MVVVNMRNPNALITMAQVSQNGNNPYLIFCEYIKYCLFINTSSEMSIKEIIEAIGKEFGIQIPYNIVLKCLQQLNSEKVVSMQNHHVKRTGSFDTKKFDEERQCYQRIENSLIKALIRYVSCHNKTWDKKYAKIQLIKVLDRNGLAYDIFMQGDISANDDYNLFSNDEIEDLLTYDKEDIQELKDGDSSLYPDSYYVSHFINNFVKKDEKLYGYLQQICKGLMLCIGTYQLNDNNKPQIKGTTFFFDTRLLLRLLGCAGEAAVQATNELVKLIQDNDGLICYYAQTWYEIDKAFEKAINQLRYGRAIQDIEMNLFASKTKYSIEVLELKKATFEKELEDKKIYKRENSHFSDLDNMNFGFKYDDFQQYMKKYLNWDDCVIENDALSIWETHMLRKGNYSEYYGTKEKLPVFVTTNSKLIGISMRYHNYIPNAKGICKWKRNRLPIITDMRLTCRLWNPSLQADKISLLYLTANTIAAQRPTKQFYDKVRELAIQFMKINKEYSNVYLPSFFDDKITSALFDKTKGNESNLNIANFTSTIEELYVVGIEKQKAENYKIAKQKTNIQNKYDLQIKEIIESSVQENKNCLGILKMDLYVILYWHIIFSLFSTAVSAVVSCLCSNWKLIFIAVIPVIITLIDKIFTSDFIIKKIFKHQLPKLEHIFNGKIEKRLNNIELKYKDQIIREIKNQTPLWCKLVDFFKDSV